MAKFNNTPFHALMYTRTCYERCTPWVLKALHGDIVMCQGTYEHRHDIHSKIRSIKPVATKVHVILWSFVVLTRVRNTIGSV
jgi:hypothetical protein